MIGADGLLSTLDSGLRLLCVKNKIYPLLPPDTSADFEGSQTLILCGTLHTIQPLSLMVVVIAVINKRKNYDLEQIYCWIKVIQQLALEQATAIFPLSIECNIRSLKVPLRVE